MTASHTGAAPSTAPVSAHEGVDIPHDCEPSSDVSTIEPDAAAVGLSGRRLIGIDVARGLALVGMMAVHVLPPAAPDGAMSTAWALSAGNAAALFALLAGVGIGFGSGGRRRPLGRRRDAAALSLVVRAVIIGAVGLLLGYVVPIEDGAVILAYYAVLFLLAIPLISLSTRALVVLAAAITVVMPVLSHRIRAELPAATATNPTFTDLLTDPVRLATELTLTGAYPALPWLAYVCAGLAVGRAALTSRATVAKIGVVGIVIAVVASAGSWLMMNVAGGWSRVEASALSAVSIETYTDAVVWGFNGVTPPTTAWWLGVMAPHSATPFATASTIGISLAVLAGALLLARVAGKVLTPLAAAGAMTFTLYTGHLLMLSAPVELGNDVVAFAGQLVIVVGFALLWGRAFSRGPLEAVVAQATGWVRDQVMSAAPAGSARRDQPARHGRR